MQAEEFQVLVRHLSRLSGDHRAMLARLLTEPLAEESVVALLESKDADQSAARIVVAKICTPGTRSMGCVAIVAPIVAAPSTL